MSLEFIYQKEANVDNENNFTIFISEKNSVEKEIFICGERCLLCSLDYKVESEDITKWSDYDKVKDLSDLISAATTKKSRTDLIFIVKLPSSLSFENKVLTLSKRPKRKICRYINTDTKIINSISFQNFQKLLLEQNLAWSNNEFIHTVSEKRGKKNIYQI